MPVIKEYTTVWALAQQVGVPDADVAAHLTGSRRLDRDTMEILKMEIGDGVLLARLFGTAEIPEGLHARPV